MRRPAFPGHRSVPVLAVKENVVSKVFCLDEPEAAVLFHECDLSQTLALDAESLLDFIAFVRWCHRIGFPERVWRVSIRKS